MKKAKRLASLSLIILAATGAQTANKKIYHKGWIDFNKNGRMDIFELPSKPCMSFISSPSAGPCRMAGHSAS